MSVLVQPFSNQVSMGAREGGVIQEGIEQLRESLPPQRVSRAAAAAVGLAVPAAKRPPAQSQRPSQVLQRRLQEE